MSRESVAVVRGVFETFSKGGQSSVDVFDLLDPEVELQDYPTVDAQWHHGHEGAKDWAVKIWRAFGRATVEPTEFIETADGRLVVAWKITGEGNLSGLNLTLTGYAVATVAGGKLRRLAVYATRADALEAVGLAE